jgi:hypothetical protein
MSRAASVAHRRQLALGAARSRVGRFDALDRTLIGVFLLAAIFYVWTAASSQPLSLHDGSSDRYNLLAGAFLHFHLSIGVAPADLLHLRDPYDPTENLRFMQGPTDATSFNDDVLYNGHLYFVWGPAPALLFLVPMHLLGFEPSASVTVTVYAMLGLGFALAALRVLIRAIGIRSLWMCALAALAPASCSVVPFLLRTPSATADTLAGGWCFAMGGIWLAFSAIANRRASLARIALMSLCFGLATLSRPMLSLTALVLIPVYWSLRETQVRRTLLLGLLGPIAVCGLLLLGYNQARFGQPLEVGSHYQLTGYDSRTAPIGHIGYVLPGGWPYLGALPRLSAVFPFILLTQPPLSEVEGLAKPEYTGGLLPMAPIVIFVLALPWIWRRRPAPVGRLAFALVLLACVGFALIFVPAYQFFAPTERYETEFATLFVLGGVAGWLVLSKSSNRLRRRLVRVGGGLLIAWGCMTGVAVSFIAADGPSNELAVKHPGTWATLEDIGSPLSTLIATLAGRPLMANVSATDLGPGGMHRYTGLETGPTFFYLALNEQAHFTIVASGRERALLTGVARQRHENEAGFPPVVAHITGPGGSARNYTLPEKAGAFQIPVLLNTGVNHFTLTPELTDTARINPSLQALYIENLSVSAR